MTQLGSEVVAIERRFWTESSDPNFFAEMMDEQALSIMEPMGFITKQEAIQMTTPDAVWTDLNMQDLHVLELTPDCVAIAYHAEAKNQKSGKPYRGSINSVYVRRDGAWKLGMTSHQPWPEKEPVKV